MAPEAAKKKNSFVPSSIGENIDVPRNI
jgi:hypothetical protein